MKNINEIKVIKKGEKDFPSRLYELKESPNEIYILGNQELLYNFSIAVIGARRCEEESVKLAEEVSYNLAKSKIQIISGMAIGIDSVAHKACLRASGKTIAVLRIRI